VTSATTPANQIEAALCNALPPELHARLPKLANLLADVAAGSLKPDQASVELKSLDLTAAFQALEGKPPVEAAGVKIEFGTDKITVGNITSSKATAIGSGAKAEVTEINLVVGSPPLPLPAWRRILGLIVGAVTLIGAALIIYQFARPHLASPPTMSGGNLNVAIAEFTQMQDDGRIFASKPAAQMARSVYNTLSKELEQLKSESSGIEVRPPEQTGAIKGATSEERANAAAQLAARINADVIFYGVLDPTSTKFTPEFYLAPLRLEKAREAAGQYAFGAPLMSDEDITRSAAANVEMTTKITRRSQALAQLVLGLSMFASHNYDAAARHFDAAASADLWNRGAELIYLFQGNTAGKLGNYDQATVYYNQALAVAPDYARARLGLAAVRLQLSKGTCERGSANIAGLEEALRLYEQARAAPNQPPEADIPVKANAGMGQIYLCLTQALAGDYSAEARHAFEAVVAEYESRPIQLRSLGAEAYANLGFLSMPFAGEQGPEAEKQYRAAAELYRKAIDVSRDRALSAVYYRWLGFIHGRLGEYQQADEAYRSAIEYASDESTRSAYETERRQLQQKRTGTITPDQAPAP
jgi:tetratricopeptide (TPR) repeat protein